MGGLRIVTIALAVSCLHAAALGAISGSTDGQLGNWENGTLALGIDGGTAAGMLIAPRLNWSARRAKVSVWV